ncbi:hypothetical protein BDN67DRAFT_962542 [Paxillus ammoniavirescens]|nr:hypothetical protein BDN67DRAFT_962542 [Paxillus ammoniavirescens]
MTSRNVIIFGETGAGKSSVVNMVAGADVAKIASTSTGCTFQSSPYPVMITGSLFTIFDTAGLNEGDPKTINKSNAIRQLYQLITSLKGGVSLLLFCMRAPRIKDSQVQNWRLFQEIICAGKVPIAIIITGLENEEGSMDNWWVENRDNFEHNDMRAAGHACVTATKGKKKGDQYLFAEEYSESRAKVQKLIVKCALRKPWMVPKIQWFAETGILCWKKEVMGKEVFQMMEKCAMSEEDAKELARELKEV